MRPVGESGNARSGVIPDNSVVANRGTVVVLQYHVVLATWSCTTAILHSPGTWITPHTCELLWLYWQFLFLHTNISMRHVFSISKTVCWMILIFGEGEGLYLPQIWKESQRKICKIKYLICIIYCIWCDTFSWEWYVGWLCMHDTWWGEGPILSPDWKRVTANLRCTICKLSN